MSDTTSPDSHLTRPKYPDALRPAIQLGKSGDTISLYQGPVHFTQNDKAFLADTHIFLAWLPSPEIRFEVPVFPSDGYPSLEGISLRLDDGTVISHGLVTGSNHSTGPEGHKWSLSGIVGERVVRPKGGEAIYAIFLVANFEPPIGQPVTNPDRSTQAARLVLVGGGWKITLDEVDNAKEVKKYLDANSGFAVTQFGKLEREGKPFKSEEAQFLLDALAWYLSFTCGRWTGPFLPQGFDSEGKQVWEIWHCSRAVPFRKRLSWMDNCHQEHFEAPFPGFLKLWVDETWEEVIRVAIHWYIEANAQAGSIEGSIVLTQTAFELLSSAVLVENHGWLSTDGYEKLPAADRIRLLFLWAGIPIVIPTELVHLTSLAKADNWPDTATAMTMIRNTITHPTRKNREKFGKHPNEARTDAWTIGLWNLELCLLRLFEYQETYGSRLKQRFSGQVQPVPWAPGARS